MYYLPLSSIYNPTFFFLNKELQGITWQHFCLYSNYMNESDASDEA